MLTTPFTTLRKPFSRADTLILNVAAIAAMLFPCLLSAQRDSVANSDTLYLTLAEARTLALSKNPDLNAARIESRVARAELQQASVLIQDNPTFDVLTRGAGPEIGVEQNIEIAGQRGARRAAAIASLQQTNASISDATRQLLARVDSSYYQMISASQKALLAEESRLLTQRLSDAARRQLEAGKISKLEYNLAVVEEGRARGRSVAAAREREDASNELRELLGLTPTTPVAASDKPSAFEAPESFDVDSLIRLALARRPDLEERAAASRRSRALASLAKREALPDISLKASSEPLEGTGKRVLRPGVGFSLPIFNRNSGEIKARTLEAKMNELQSMALAARIRIEVTGGVRAYQNAEAEAKLLETTVLGPARENRALLELAYREGKIGLPVLLLVRTQVIDAESEYWDAWLAARQAMTQLKAATGG